MTIFQTIILGILQGITEFLPISSDGHLAILQNFFNIKEPMLFFNVMLHIGTLAATILVFFKDIKEILISSYTGLISFLKTKNTAVIKTNSELKFILYMLISLVPTGIIGLLLKDFVEKTMTIPVFVYSMLIITGLVLFTTRFFQNGNKNLNFLKAFIIGVGQGIAVLPGISRSCMTISTALFFGLSSKESARFSFLISIPAILGATLLETLELEGALFNLQIITGMLIAFVVGVISLKLLLKILNSGKFNVFSYYCFLVGGALLIWSLIN